MSCPICEGFSVGNRLCARHKWEKKHPEAVERRRKRENGLCIVEGCENPRYAGKAKCRTHYHEMPSQRPEAIRERSKEWWAALKDGGEALLKAQKANHAAKKRGLEATLSAEQVAALIETTHACPYCGATLNRRNRELDHIHPLSQGGTSTIDNVQIICKNCNRAKGEQDESEFTNWLDRILVHRSKL